MASPISAGTSSGSSLLQNSGSDQDVQAVMDQKKRKRMISNRESARRSRMRKQKHLDDLVAQVNQLKHDNGQIRTTLALTTQHFCSVEAENSVLRTQMIELSNRLESLNDILFYLNAINTTTNINNYGIINNHNNNRNNNYLDSELLCEGPQLMVNDSSLVNPWINNLSYMSHPIIASADHNMFQY